MLAAVVSEVGMVGSCELVAGAVAWERVLGESKAAVGKWVVDEIGAGMVEAGLWSVQSSCPPHNWSWTFV